VRLAFLTHEPFYPPSGGGSAEAVYLVEEFVRRGHEVHVFCPAIAGAEKISARFNIRLHLFSTWQMGRYTTLRNFKYLLYPFALERMVARAARATKFDLLLSQHTISAVAAGRLRARLGVPVVMNFLDYLTGFMETWPAWLAPKPLLAALKKFELTLPLRYQADGVLAVSDVLADYFAETGFPRTRIQTICYGYDGELFRPPATAAPASPPVVVMHGSFDQHHLGPIAGRALLRVHGARPDVEFKFIGQQTATLEKFLHRVTQSAPGLRVISTGFVPYHEIASQLAAATVGIVPYEESTGTHCAFVAKIVEYLGVGIPAVCTPLRNSKRYFANEPAVRFSNFTGDGFGDEILACLAETPQRRRQLGLAASGRVRVELDWRAVGRRAVDFVESVQGGWSGDH